MSRQLASSVHEPDLGKVHRGESLIRGTPFHGRRQPERQFDGHLGKPVNTRLCKDGGDDAADRGRTAIDVVAVRENGFHRLVGPQARGKVDRLALACQIHGDLAGRVSEQRKVLLTWENEGVEADILP
jgi:hypothetical protein